MKNGGFKNGVKLGFGVREVSSLADPNPYLCDAVEGIIDNYTVGPLLNVMPARAVRGQPGPGVRPARGAVVIDLPLVALVGDDDSHLGREIGPAFHWHAGRAEAAIPRLRVRGPSAIEN